MPKTHFLHPGEILKLDYLEGHGISIAKAAAAMDITRARLNEIVRGRRSITADTALRLARFFRWGGAILVQSAGSLRSGGSRNGSAAKSGRYQADCAVVKTLSACTSGQSMVP